MCIMIWTNLMKTQSQAEPAGCQGGRVSWAAVELTTGGCNCLNARELCFIGTFISSDI